MEKIDRILRGSLWLQNEHDEFILQLALCSKASEATDPAELTWWAAGAIEVEDTEGIGDRVEAVEAQ